MKKIVIAMMMVAAVSYGEVKVDWSAGAGFYFTADPFVGILGDATGDSTIAQLMYSTDNVKDDINTLGVGVDNDVVWGSVLLTENGTLGDFDDYAAFASYEERAFVGGWVYALIFQDNAIGANDWYFYTPMLALQDITGLTLAQVLSMNTDDINGNAIDSATGGGVSNPGLVAQVIPEPATMLLFGIGGFGAWLLRRRQQA